MDPKLKLILKESYFEIIQISHDAHIMVSIHAVSATTYKYDAWLAGAWGGWVAAGREEQAGRFREIPPFDWCARVRSRSRQAGFGHSSFDWCARVRTSTCAPSYSARPRAPSRVASRHTQLTGPESAEPEA